MTDTPKEPRPYNVGYGKPPVNRQFKPGTSGNPTGGSRKRRAAVPAVPADLLNQPLAVRDNGVLRQVHPKDLALRQQVKKALEEDDTAVQLHLLDQFQRHGLLDAASPDLGGGVLDLSDSTMPFEMGHILVLMFGPGPWTLAQLAKGRVRYLANRSPKQAQIDDLIGYPALRGKGNTA